MRHLTNREQPQRGNDANFFRDLEVRDFLCVERGGLLDSYFGYNYTQSAHAVNGELQTFNNTAEHQKGIALM